MIWSHKTVGQYHKKDIDIDRIKAQTISIAEWIPHVIPRSSSLFPPKLLIITNVFSPSIILWTKEYYINGIIQNVIFRFFHSSKIFGNSSLLLSFNCSFLLLMRKISQYICTTVCLSIHPRRNSCVVSNILQSGIKQL